MTSSTTMCAQRALATTRTSLAQHAARRTSRAASRSPRVIPAPHHNATRSPNAAGVVYRMTGGLPSRVRTQACLQPVLTRCGVMRHQTRPISRRRDGGRASPAASQASPVAAIAISQAAPSA
jgi:hypothetical protein